MPTYLVLANYTDQGLRNIKEAPASGFRVEEAIEMDMTRVPFYSSSPYNWPRTRAE